MFEIYSYAKVGNEISFSENALTKCPHCGTYFWTPWWPICCGCNKDVRDKVKENDQCRKIS